jgi:hypothetical protein
MPKMGKLAIRAYGKTARNMEGSIMSVKLIGTILLLKAILHGHDGLATGKP